jgi:hypothetical protein
VLADAYDKTFGSAPSSSTVKPTPLYIIASPRALCGKTFLALLITDYLSQDGRRVEAFDLNPGEHALAACRPKITIKADLATTSAQMSLFERLIANEGRPKVVDLGYALFERFFAMCEEIGFVDAAKRRGLEVIILFPAEPHPSAVVAYEQLQKRLPNAALVAVLNEAVLKGSKVRDFYPAARESAVALQVPLMPLVLKAYAERLSESLAHVRAQLPSHMPMGHALELRSWTRRVFLEFREFELRLTLEKLRVALKS